jgi:hypothetical protein
MIAAQQGAEHPRNGIEQEGDGCSKEAVRQDSLPVRHGCTAGSRSTRRARSAAQAIKVPAKGTRMKDELCELARDIWTSSA